jgi:hypothetical protein
VAQALEDLNLIGWDLRYVWDDVAGEFQLLFSEPDRSKSTPDHTFTTSDYFTLTDVARGRTGVRNKVEVKYDADLSQVVTEDDSITEFGTRYMLLDYSQSLQITTSAAATALGVAVVADTAFPALTHTAEMAFWPLVELGDLYRYRADGIHYSADQDVAVVAWTHEFRAGEAPTTMLQCRGAPAAGTARWYRKGQRSRLVEELAEELAVPAPLVYAGFVLTLDQNGQTRLAWTGTSQIASIRYAHSTSSMPANLTTSTAVNGQTGNTTVGSALTESQTMYVRAAGYTEVDGAGTKTDVDFTAQVGYQPSAAPVPGIQGWSHDMVFSATDNDTVAWTAGDITLTDGSTFAIAGGNTGNISALTFIFLDTAVSINALQTTTTASAAAGSGRILIAVAKNVADAAKKCEFQVFGGGGGVNKLITADAIAANTVTANEIAANTITASEIAANTITASEIAANTITASEIAANTITASEIAATTITGTEINSLSISGKTLTADTGTVGGWTLASGELSSGSVKIQATAERLLLGSATAPMTGTGIFLGKDGSDYEMRVGDPDGAYMHWDGTKLNLSATDGYFLAHGGTLDDYSDTYVSARALQVRGKIIFAGERRDNVYVGRNTKAGVYGPGLLLSVDDGSAGTGYTDGNIELEPAGTGRVLVHSGLDVSGSFVLGGETVSFGANDSAGTGYRLLRVPNEPE